MLPRNRSPNSEDFSLKFALSVAEEILSQRNAAESVEAVSLD